jgi:hypothetical protein
MIARNSYTPPPPSTSTMLVQTMIVGPQTNIVNGEGAIFGNFWKVYELISMIMHVIRRLWWLFRTYYIGIFRFFPLVRHLWIMAYLFSFEPAYWALGWIFCGRSALASNVTYCIVSRCLHVFLTNSLPH